MLKKCVNPFLLCSVHQRFEMSMSSKFSTVEDQTTVEDISFSLFKTMASVYYWLNVLAKIMSEVFLF